MLTGEFKAALIRNQSTTCSWINGWTTLHYLACPYTVFWGIVWWQVCCNCNDTSEDLDKCGTNPHGMRHGCVTRSNVLHTMYVMFAYLWLCLCIVVFIQQDGIQCSFARRSSCCKIATAEVLHSNLLDLYGTVGGGTFAVWQNKKFLNIWYTKHQTTVNGSGIRWSQLFYHLWYQRPRHTSLWPHCREFRLGEVQLAPSGDMDMDASMRKTSKSCAGTANL